MLYRPDELVHRNPNYAIVDSNNVRGGHHQVENTAARNTIPVDKRALKMIVSYNDGVEEVTMKFIGAQTIDSLWTNDSYWLTFGGDTTYSDTHINGKSTSTIDALNTGTGPGAIENGQVLTWDNAAGEYILSAASGGSGLGAGSGLTEGGGDTNLGGALTGITTIGELTNEYAFTVNNYLSLQTYRANGFGNSEATIYLNGSAEYATIGITNSASDVIWITANDTDSVKITDTAHSFGMRYSADYSTAGIAEDRWIPDWNAVKTQLIGKDTTIIDALNTNTGPGAIEDGYALVWNQTAGEYILSSVAGGTTPGIDDVLAEAQALTDKRTIEVGAGNQLKIEKTDGDVTYQMTIGTTEASLETIDASISSQSLIKASLLSVAFGMNWAAGFSTLQISDSLGMQVADTMNSTGFNYLADYSVIGKTLDRWIPDYAAVTSQLIGKATTTIDALNTNTGPGVIEDGYALVWNQSAGEYILSAVAGGSTPGIDDVLAEAQTLTTKRTLDCGSVGMKIEAANATKDYRLLITNTEAGLQYFDTATSTQQDITIKDGYISLSRFDGSDGFSLVINDANGIVWNDSRLEVGMVYDADYSTNGTSNDRWVPDYAAVKAYADGIDSFTGGITVGVGQGFTVNDGLSFGVGNAHIYEYANGNLAFFAGGNIAFYLDGIRFQGENTGNFYIPHSTVTSSTVPVFTFRNDILTGLGCAATGQLSNIANGVEAVRYEEASSHVIQKVEVDAAITASATQTQGQQVLLSSYNVITTVATTGDVVTLPVAEVGRKVVVINKGANAMALYPSSGDDLGLGVDTSISVSSGNKFTFLAYDSTNWTQI